MDLNQIYRPIKEELNYVEEVLETSLRESNNESVLKVNNFLLESGGKRLRPALVILSTKATLGQKPKTINRQLIKIASAIELIHMASLIHDDIIDHAALRHNKPTINSRWGQDVSIALGDYLYSLAFKLISSCSNTDILDCISSATKSMCEGELVQVCERDNLDLLKERYIVMIKKKTAALFAASCQAGAIISHCRKPVQSALKEYGLNFGIVFQIIDDYLDVVGEREKIGKHPGQDIYMGEVTLPILNLLDSVNEDEREIIKRLLRSKAKDGLRKIRKRFFNSDALLRTKKDTLSYINLAKERLKVLPQSDYRKGLFDLADFILQPFKKFVVEEVK